MSGSPFFQNVFIYIFFPLSNGPRGFLAFVKRFTPGQWLDVRSAAIAHHTAVSTTSFFLFLTSTVEAKKKSSPLKKPHRLFFLELLLRRRLDSTSHGVYVSLHPCRVAEFTTQRRTQNGVPPGKRFFFKKIKRFRTQRLN